MGQNQGIEAANKKMKDQKTLKQVTNNILKPKA